MNIENANCVTDVSKYNDQNDHRNLSLLAYDRRFQMSSLTNPTRPDLYICDPTQPVKPLIDQPNYERRKPVTLAAPTAIWRSDAKFATRH